MEQVREGLRWALLLYPRRVQCLQRSTASARVLRRFGCPAELVIGYRPQPFLGHAWVEVANRVFEGPESYRQRLTVLQRLG